MCVQAAVVAVIVQHRMTTFRKTSDCPTSWELLDLSAGIAEPRIERRLLKHTLTCEFCSAELSLYSESPPMDSAVETPPIPEPLYELAVALLTRESVMSVRLETLLGVR